MDSPTRRLVPAVGAIRRLQAIACAGYGLGAVAKALHTRRLLVQRLRRGGHRQVTQTTHERVADLYDLWWDTNGPSDAARKYAATRGWYPFEAWTDAIIDDPTQGPYSDPEAVGYLDMVLLDQVIHRKAAFARLTDAEAMWLFRRHVAAGGTDRSFRDRYRPVQAATLRRLREAL